MNVEGRAALYAEVRRDLAPGGRPATYDLVLRDGNVVYPAPWARDVSSSFLLSEADTRRAFEQAGFNAPQSGPNLGVVMGPEFPTVISNLARNVRENRLGVLSAVLTRD